MKIFLLGYGKMGKEIEKMAPERGYEIIGIYDPYSAHNKFDKKAFSHADVAIEFSTPGSAPYNILQCFENNIPVVVGTTGWYDEFESIKEQCKKYNGSLFYASNYSIGVNIMFRLADFLSRFMVGHHGYSLEVHEAHHIHKKDAPSGTAITLAEKLLKNHNNIKSWYGLMEGETKKDDASLLPIFSLRKDEIVGNHEIIYESGGDKISIRHEAFNRQGFAAGTLLAAAWLQGKRGIFTMSDILDS